MIDSLGDENAIVYGKWINYKRMIEGISLLIKQSGSLSLSSHGNLNSYRLFAELGVLLLSPTGLSGMILQTGLATDETSRYLLESLVCKGQLVSFLDFENRGNFFIDVHSQFRFALATLSGSSTNNKTSKFGWLLHDISELKSFGRLISLSADDLRIFNPNSGTAPTFNSEKDFLINRCIYLNSTHIFCDNNIRFGNIDFQGELFNMTRDSNHFQSYDVIDEENRLPLYEAKYIHKYDHRYATQVNDGTIECDAQLKMSAEHKINTRFYITKSEVDIRANKQGIKTNWMFGFRSVSSATNENTAILSIFPYSGVGNSINLILNLNPKQAVYLLANGNTYIFDYTCRQKMSGMNVNIWIMKQLPVIPENQYDTIIYLGQLYKWMYSRVIELSYTAWDLEPFAKDCGYNGSPFIWDDERRFKIRAELDAAYFYLYLGTKKEWQEKGSKELLDCFPTPRHAVDYIMETFPIVKRRDEAQYGSYRTKELILEIYDKMAECIATGKEYKTILDPPPGPPCDAQGNFIPMSKWDKKNWPSHIHPPRS